MYFRYLLVIHIQIYESNSSGETIGRYVILHNMSWNLDFSTWLCKDTKMNEYVILKIFSAREELTKMVMLEIELLQTIHKKIMSEHEQHNQGNEEEEEDTYFVKLFNAFRYKTCFDQNRFRYVLVYETYGFDCSQLYESKKILLTNTNDLINQIIFTINLLHDKCGIVHGDLSH